MSKWLERRQAFIQYGVDYEWEGRAVRRTPKAILFEPDSAPSFWVPMAAIHPLSEVPRTSRGMLVVQLWFAQRAGWVNKNLTAEFGQKESNEYG